MTQKIRILNNQTANLYFNVLNTFNGMELYELSPLPAWIVPNNPATPYILYLALSPTVTGTFTYDFTLGGSPSTADATLIIEVVDSLTETISTCNNSTAICLVWITREGGRASYIFDQRKDFNVKLGESKTFDNGGQIKYFDRGKNFDGKIVYKTGLSDDEMYYIESLRTSIQAWEYDLTTDVSTPIIVDPDNFDLPGTKTRLNEINIRYRIAKYKITQSQ